MRAHTLPIFFALVFVLMGSFAVACGGGGGSCIGRGGVLSSPECKDGWSRDECEDWDTQKINDANWTYSKSSCVASGYSAMCSDGSYRLSQSDC